MEENNRKGPGVFYAVMGVATLVVAIIGATFAYFGATTEVNTDIQGEAATAGLSLDVEKISTDAVAGLIPLDDANVVKALAGDTKSGSKMCVDANGNTVCQVYKITVNNTGSATAVINGTIELAANTGETGSTGSTFTNLKWQLLTGTEVNSLATTTTYNAMGVTSLVSDVSLEPADVSAETDTAVYYVMVWISNLTDEDQSGADKGHFMGSVQFNSADGSGVSASFSA